MIVLNDPDHPTNDSTAEMMTWRRVYPGHPDQAPKIRHFVACLLTDFPCVDDIVNATAELVANALRHTRSGKAASPSRYGAGPATASPSP